MKKCGKCKLELPFECFHKCSREKSGLQQWCKSCRKTQNPELRREYHRKRYHDQKTDYLQWMYGRRYGITLEQYNQMLENQNNVCKICKQSCSSGRRLAVDHCHTTGKIRGLLCGNCNKALGCFKDDPELIRKAIKYLQDNE